MVESDLSSIMMSMLKLKCFLRFSDNSVLLLLGHIVRSCLRGHYRMFRFYVMQR